MFGKWMLGCKEGLDSSTVLPFTFMKWPASSPSTRTRMKATSTETRGEKTWASILEGGSGRISFDTTQPQPGSCLERPAPSDHHQYDMARTWKPIILMRTILVRRIILLVNSDDLILPVSCLYALHARQLLVLLEKYVYLRDCLSQHYQSQVCMINLVILT